MSGKQIVIYTAANLPQAHLLRNTLEDLGIRAGVINDAVQMAIGDLPGGWPTAPRVVVDEQHAELARRVALEFDAAGRESRLQADDEPDRSGDDDAAAAWPACPKCGQRRQAICPFCGTQSEEFPAADLSYQLVEGQADEQAAADPSSATDSLAAARTIRSSRIWLVCSTCDEPFEAQYGRICAQCGNDVHDGVEREEPPPALIFSPGLWIPIAGAALLFLWRPEMGCIAVLAIFLAAMIRRSKDG